MQTLTNNLHFGDFHLRLKNFGYMCHVISTGSKTWITTVEKIDFTFRNGKDIDFDLARTSSKPSLWWEGSTVQLVGRELKEKIFC